MAEGFRALCSDEGRDRRAPMECVMLRTRLLGAWQRFFSRDKSRGRPGINDDLIR